MTGLFQEASCLLGDLHSTLGVREPSSPLVVERRPFQVLQSPLPCSRIEDPPTLQNLFIGSVLLRSLSHSLDCHHLAGVDSQRNFPRCPPESGAGMIHRTSYSLLPRPGMPGVMAAHSTSQLLSPTPRISLGGSRLGTRDGPPGSGEAGLCV